MVCRRCGFSFADNLSICPSCRTPAAEPPAWLFVSDPVTSLTPPPPAPVVENAQEPPLVAPETSPVAADIDPGYFGRRSTAWAEAFPEAAPPPEHLSSNPWVSFDDDTGEELGSLFTEQPPQPGDGPARSSDGLAQTRSTPPGLDGSANLDPLSGMSLDMHPVSGSASLSDEALFLASDLPDLSAYQEQLEKSLAAPLPPSVPVSSPPPPAPAPVEQPGPVVSPASSTPPVVSPPEPFSPSLDPAVPSSPASPSSPVATPPPPALVQPPEPPAGSVPSAALLSSTAPVVPPVVTYDWSPLPETKVPQALFMGNRLPSTPSAETSLRVPSAPTPIVAPPILEDGVIVDEDQGREKRRSRVVENRALIAVLVLGVVLVAAITLAVVFILSN